MPGLNRRGPNGEGPMTGRKMGRCNPDNKGKTEEEIFQNRNMNNREQDTTFGQGWGRGKGRGMGKGPGRGLGRRFGQV
ncbi:MAG TPA: DUF5320 domain-containing protein [Bacteroidales bacterium]|nr:DUF5320 domain-containing protein [Bacteroidales bacterium]